MSLTRIIDFLVSCIGIVLISPLLLIIAVAVKLESRGPVYYRCARVGQHGELFGMFKFRTMVEVADRIDCKLCCNSDVRVTPIGKLLRRTKLNELPQLFNVVLGDMSLVGPRPEDPKFVCHYPDKWAAVLQAKPGIVGPNQILHRNEEDLFPPDQDPESFYVTDILPEKLERDIEYLKDRSLWTDFMLLLRGVHATVFKGRVLTKNAPRGETYLELLLDVILSVLAYLLANFIRFETVQFDGNVYRSLALIAGINSCLFLGARLYARNVRFFSFPDLLVLMRIVAVAAILFLVAYTMAGLDAGHSRAVFFLYPAVLLILLAGTRVALRMYFERREVKQDACQVPFNTVVYGAGRMGVETARHLQFDPDINLLGFVDDNQSLKDRFILGMRVVGNARDLPHLKELYMVQCVVIAFHPHSPEELETAQQRCVSAGIPEIRVVSSDNGLRRQPKIHHRLRKVRLSDELGMADVPLIGEAGDLLEGAVAGIIGADHLGEHLCRELGRLGVQKIVMVDSCRARLRMADRLQGVKNGVPEIATFYQPWGLHEETQRILEEHKVRWLFFNHLSRRVPHASLNESELFLDFVETIRYVSMAQRFACEGFTLVSPRRADCFRDQERSYHHLCEDYVRFAAESSATGVRSGTVQIPNLLEDTGGIIHETLQHLAMDPCFSVPDAHMRFSSARYAARTILNSMPMHGQGDTYVQFPAHILSLRSLVQRYSGNHSIDANGNGGHNGVTSDACDGARTLELGDLSDSLRTSVKQLRIVKHLALPDLLQCEKGIHLYGRYMTREDRTALRAYVSFLRSESPHADEFCGPSHLASNA